MFPAARNFGVFPREMLHWREDGRDNPDKVHIYSVGQSWVGLRPTGVLSPSE
jgi:hypothetical protein